MIDTGAVTVLLLATLREGGSLVGDGIAPEGGGWLSGQPNVSAFHPYGVLAFTGGMPPDTTFRYSEQVRSWELSWRLGAYGGSRAQCDRVAGVLRGSLEGVLGLVFGDPAYRVTGLSWRSLGPMTRNDSIDPPMWSVLDSFSVRCDA